MLYFFIIIITVFLAFGCGGSDSDGIIIPADIKNNKLTILKNNKTYIVDVSLNSNAVISEDSVSILDISEVPQTNKPTDYDFPDGLISFTINNLNSNGGDVISVVLTFPTNYPTNAKYFKVSGAGFEEFSDAVFNGNQVTISLTDNGNGDFDSVLGQITDPGGPAIPVYIPPIDKDDPIINPNNVDNDNDGYTENQGDCNDADADINPGIDEIYYDGIDQNCDGRDEYGMPDDHSQIFIGATDLVMENNDTSNEGFINGVIQFKGDVDMFKIDLNDNYDIHSMKLYIVSSDIQQLKLEAHTEHYFLYNGVIDPKSGYSVIEGETYEDAIYIKVSSNPNQSNIPYKLYYTVGCRENLKVDDSLVLVEFKNKELDWTGISFLFYDIDMGYEYGMKDDSIVQIAPQKHGYRYDWKKYEDYFNWFIPCIVGNEIGMRIYQNGEIIFDGIVGTCEKLQRSAYDHSWSCINENMLNDVDILDPMAIRYSGKYSMNQTRLEFKCIDQTNCDYYKLNR
ncbi:MAG: putative metal-binding motif-containing protein [Bacteroidota bacterium]